MTVTSQLTFAATSERCTKPQVSKQTFVSMLSTTAERQLGHAEVVSPSHSPTVGSRHTITGLSPQTSAVQTTLGFSKTANDFKQNGFKG
jgi:hypothetical protein